MKANTLSILAAVAMSATPVLAQETGTAETQPTDSTPKAEAPAKKALSREDFVQKIGVQRLRPNDQRGLHIFETPKKDAVPFTGLAVEFGVKPPTLMLGTMKVGDKVKVSFDLYVRN